jgi:hypothetical protein
MKNSGTRDVARGESVQGGYGKIGDMGKMV